MVSKVSQNWFTGDLVQNFLKLIVLIILCYLFFSYGDRSPRGFVARIFAIIWVLIGLVITSIFTGVVTTSLTAITLSTDVKLYGTKVGFSFTYKVNFNIPF